MVSKKQLKQTQNLINGYVAAYIQQRPGVLKHYTREQIKDVATNQLLKQAFERMEVTNHA